MDRKVIIFLITVIILLMIMIQIFYIQHIYFDNKKTEHLLYSSHLMFISFQEFLLYINIYDLLIIYDLFFHHFHNQKLKFLLLLLINMNEYLLLLIFIFLFILFLSFLEKVNQLDQHESIMYGDLIFPYNQLPKYKLYHLYLQPYYEHFFILLCKNLTLSKHL